MAKKPDLKLTREEIERALARPRGLSFAPRANGKLSCNQARRLGTISTRQADALRNQVRPRKRLTKPKNDKGWARMQSVRSDSNEMTTCPRCGARYYNVTAFTVVRCGNCGISFRVYEKRRSIWGWG